MTSPPTITSQTWAIFNSLEGKFLWGKKAHSKREIASLTKMMTCILTLKLIEKYNLNVQNIYFRVSYAASSVGGTRADLFEYENVLLQDLLYALMLPSGNDAAIVLGENLGTIIYLKEYAPQGSLFRIPQL